MTDDAVREQEGLREREARARFLARVFDLTIVVTPLFLALSIVVGIVCGLTGHLEVVDLMQDRWASMIIGYLGMFLIGALFEAACLSAFGSTPGKSLMGVRVYARDGRNPGFFTSLGRWGECLVIGRGLGLPLVSLIAGVNALDRYKKDGTTAWDEHSHTEVRCKRVGAWRWALGVLAWMASITLLVASRLLDQGQS